MAGTLLKTSLVKTSLGGLISAACVCGLAMNAAAMDSRTYVVGWFSEATYSQDNDCPGGINPGIDQQYLKNLRDLGYTPAQVEDMAAKDDAAPVREAMRMRGRIDGKPASPYVYPASVVDPKLTALSSKFAYGFNLDGKDTGLEDPQTHEKGVDHQLAVALGCMRSFRGSLEGRPTYFAWAWGQLKDSEPAWLITLSAEDLTKDGDVTVTFDRAFEHLRSNVDGSPRPDTTYRADPDPRSHNSYRGQIKKGVITVAAQGDFHMMKNPLVVPEFDLHKAQLRLTLKPDGNLDGLIGGYQPWRQLYFAFASGGPGQEYCVTGDIPGLFYLMKNHADADPDPKTGQNMSISAAYYLEAVPAFVAQADKRVSSAR
jgi:hypothetical protein